MIDPRVLRAGERGVLLEFASLTEAIGWRSAFDRTPIAGVTDAVSGARTVLLLFDTTVGRAAVTAAALSLGPVQGPAADGAKVEIPVAYDGDDLAATAELLGLSPRELIELHTSQLWTCAFGGFAPGFGYLVGDETAALNVPRLPTPRTRVPAGAVGLAGEFTGVYPRDSPGGWRLIGRTAMPMWSLERVPPATLTVGARVRFVEAMR